MKKTVYVVWLFLMFLSFPSVVFAQDNPLDGKDKPSDTNGVYLGLIGGYSIPSSTSATFTRPSGIGLSFDTSLKNGFLYGGRVGWLTPFTNRILVAELEYNHLENKFSSFGGMAYGLMGDGDLSGKMSMELFMLNLLARKPDGRFHPYAGFGLGYADVKVDEMLATVAVPVGGVTFARGSKGVFAYQLLAGVDIDITKNIFVGLGYKYIAPQKVSYDTHMIVLGTDQPGEMEVDYKSHNLTLSVCYMF